MKALQCDSTVHVNRGFSGINTFRRSRKTKLISTVLNSELHLSRFAFATPPSTRWLIRHPYWLLNISMIVCHLGIVFVCLFVCLLFVCLGFFIVWWISCWFYLFIKLWYCTIRISFHYNRYELKRLYHLITHRCSLITDKDCCKIIYIPGYMTYCMVFNLDTWIFNTFDLITMTAQTYIAYLEAYIDI